MPRPPRTLLATACALAVFATAACSPGGAGSAAPATTAPATSAAPSASVGPTDGDRGVSLIVGGPAHASVLTRDVVVTGLKSPWALAFLPDGSFLVSERDTGFIKHIRAGVAVRLNGPGAQAIRAKIVPAGEGGLLGLAISPADPTLVYAYVSRADGNAVVRMALSGDLLSNPVDIVTHIPHAKNHNGGGLAFGPDGFLYISTGDATTSANAQDEASLAGKILRVIADGADKDGSPAPGNPFDSQVWSLGHRNVEGFGWVSDGRMYASELGQDLLDELNLITAGANYGWPTVEGTARAPAGTVLGATADGLTYPVAQWSTDDASPSGIAITHEAIYVAALKGERLWRVPLTRDGTRIPEVILDGLGRIRNVVVGPDGALYVLTNNTDGRGKPRAEDDHVVRITVG